MKRSVLFTLIPIIVLLALTVYSLTEEQWTAGPVFPEITKPYDPERAEQNGDVVLAIDRKANLEKWEHFLESLKIKRVDAIRITQYTVEGDPVFSELFYNGKSIHFTYDDSLDGFGEHLIRTRSICKAIGTVKLENGNGMHILEGCNNGIGRYFAFP
ncbi:DUF4362 domain-containing protein [Gorillibacterium massiliense]|uniref:DUF4362 domain-containing protein n=1 Tax=Gorillibacterium massiliense TaxID=1280390 RepID=UPI0004BCB837|nr:DUF4362 domain-containing protein [Gorillibacterium massiliense]